MRRINWRFVSAGVLLLVLAAGFYFIMLANVSMSFDPAEMMQTVGSVSGTMVGIGVVLIVLGLIGKSQQSK